jgi:hypothetical protein
LFVYFVYKVNSGNRQIRRRIVIHNEKRDTLFAQGLCRLRYYVDGRQQMGMVLREKALRQKCLVEYKEMAVSRFEIKEREIWI